ncbi:hypothetical protein HPP92_008162 [Vanilla planifolia]|uniref:Uncharacterized protein n=1 Tax=Vanilla planifolia TaxID=51239 RepID=A0A835V5E9_VANPL|nr:hypothetical protein HPP92_008162 [Vanilla planifolia]
MLARTLKYLLGSTGQSGFGSSSTANEVTTAAASATDLRSLTAIITGATSGIGLETASVLVAHGVRLILAGRNRDVAEESRLHLASSYPDCEIIVFHLDLGSLSSVRSFVSQFLALGLPLNLLINNAGRFVYEQAVSEDGIELTFATNYLGHFLLTKLLLEKMAETARESGIEGRIVNVSSGSHRCRYDAGRAYGLSKLAMVMHTKEMARRLKRLTQAAATTCYVAVHPAMSGVSGKYYADCNMVETSNCEEEAEARLWCESEAMIHAAEERAGEETE